MCRWGRWYDQIGPEDGAQGSEVNVAAEQLCFPLAGLLDAGADGAGGPVDVDADVLLRPSRLREQPPLQERVTARIDCLW